MPPHHRTRKSILSGTRTAKSGGDLIRRCVVNSTWRSPSERIVLDVCGLSHHPLSIREYERHWTRKACPLHHNVQRPLHPREWTFEDCCFLLSLQFVGAV
ncbi:hypothetical protein CDAR_204941 [Caerostris darwini]|uniref:Uncharacterized protein n=1 Tax=Caerostris darwini TaxID=1538125 RepID=A0AAV4SVW1_9ARAC|nr:hypothetical protein CDAR_204941 [Caerostris darwini]